MSNKESNRTWYSFFRPLDPPEIHWKEFAKTFPHFYGFYLLWDNKTGKGVLRSYTKRTNTEKLFGARNEPKYSQWAILEGKGLYPTKVTHGSIVVDSGHNNEEQLVTIKQKMSMLSKRKIKYKLQ